MDLLKGQFSYEDMIDKKSIVSKLSNISKFPIFPAVYGSQFAYGEIFLNIVKREVENSIVGDECSLAKNGIDFEPFDDSYLNKMELYLDSERKTLTFGFGDSFIHINRMVNSEGRIIINENEILPSLRRNGRYMEFSKLEDKIEIPSWETHTVSDSGHSVYMILRNFAYLFNNLGVQVLNESPELR